MTESHLVSTLTDKKKKNEEKSKIKKECRAKWNLKKYRKFSIKPPGGLIIFKHSRGGSIGERANKRGGLINFYSYCLVDTSLVHSRIQQMKNYLVTFDMNVFIRNKSMNDFDS